MAQLEIQNLCKSFKDDAILKGVSLSVDKGEIVTLFGPSGTGKTVLLRLIAGIYAPDAGTIATSRPRRVRQPAGEARDRHGLPEFRAVSAHDGARQYRERA